jgi:ribonuclease HI
MAGMKANTPEETEAALEELGVDCIRIYTDGGGPDEHGDTAGWGAHAVQVHADGRAEVLAQLWGPVVTDPTSVRSIGCMRPTNNTAEVTGMSEGLELIDQRPAGNTYAILFDSMYAANVAEGNWTARTNLDTASRTMALLAEVRQHNDAHLIHVKGHSVHKYPGNDIADELAWWGKEGPPFCRLRPGGGEGASRDGPAANYDAERRAEEKAAVARGPLRWEPLRMRRKGVLVEPPSERALRLTWRAWREALPKMFCVMV